MGIAFAKHLGPSFLPPAPSIPLDPSSSSTTTTTVVDTTSSHDFPSLSSSSTTTNPDTGDSLVPRELKDRSRRLLLAYLTALSRLLTRSHLSLLSLDKRNHEAYIRSGEIFEDREKSYERSVKAWERGWSGVVQLSEVLGVQVPELPGLGREVAGGVVVGGTSGREGSGAGEQEWGTGGVWADEEEKRFYEDLRELKGEVPASFLGVGVGVGGGAVTDKPTEEEEEEKEPPIDASPTEVDADPAEEPSSSPSTALPSSPLTNPTTLPSDDPLLPPAPAAQLTALFARLSEASSRATIDAVALEFVFLVGGPAGEGGRGKAGRRRLVKVRWVWVGGSPSPHFTARDG